MTRSALAAHLGALGQPPRVRLRPATGCQPPTQLPPTGPFGSRTPIPRSVPARPPGDEEETRFRNRPTGDRKLEANRRELRGPLPGAGAGLNAGRGPLVAARPRPDLPRRRSDRAVARRVAARSQGDRARRAAPRQPRSTPPAARHGRIRRPHPLSPPDPHPAAHLGALGQPRRSVPPARWRAARHPHQPPRPGPRVPDHPTFPKTHHRPSARGFSHEPRPVVGFRFRRLGRVHSDVATDSLRGAPGADRAGARRFGRPVRTGTWIVVALSSAVDRSICRKRPFDGLIEGLPRTLSRRGLDDESTASDHCGYHVTTNVERVTSVT